MFHCKAMTVDDLWVSVGSTNFDDRLFAKRQAAIIREDLSQCKEMTLKGWRRRPVRERFTDWAAGLVRSQL